MIGRFSAGFLLVSELSQTKHAALTGTALMVGDAAATLYCTLWYRVCPYAKGMVWIGFAANIATFIMSFFIPESPRWYLSNGYP